LKSKLSSLLVDWAFSYEDFIQRKTFG